MAAKVKDMEDALASVDELRSELQSDFEDGLLEDLNTAESCEKDSDFIANIRSAEGWIAKMQERLTAFRKEHTRE